MNLLFSKQSFNHFNKCHVLNDLRKIKSKRKPEEFLMQEVYSILYRSRMNKENILQNLDIYQQSQYLLDDDEIDAENIYTIKEIEKICTLYRLKFLDIQHFKKEIPTIAEIKIEYLNDKYMKKIGGLKILSYKECFTDTNFEKNYGILFAPTINKNYYLIHQWGNPIPKNRKWKYYPLRSFHTLALSILVFTLVVDLILPTDVITLDKTATYWCGYRLGAYFHLLIFFSGFTVFIVFSFFKNFSKNSWTSI